MAMEKQSLYYLVRDTVATFAERPCYWVRMKESFGAVSYFNWREDMKRFQASMVHKYGMKHGDRVGLLCDNRYEWNLISLGITTAGGIDVPRGTDATAQDILFILNHTECQTVIIEHEKMMKVLLEKIDELPFIKNVISIEPPGKYKKLDEAKKKLRDINLSFLIDLIADGDEILETQGDEFLRKRGEAIKPDDIATIIYTSGTTGTPKGVVLEHRSFCWEVAQIQSYAPLSEVDRCVIFLPPWHIAERLLETVLIACGASMANSSIITLSQDLENVKPTVLVSVPRVWEQLYRRVNDNVRKQPESKQNLFRFARNVAQMNMDITDTLMGRFAEVSAEPQSQRMIRKAISAALFIPFRILNIGAQLILKKVKGIFGGSLRFAISGAGALPDHVSTFFRSIGIPIIDGYGMTETTGVSVMSEFPWPKRGCVGPVLPGVQIQLRTEQGDIVTKNGIKGIAWHKGPHIMRGYYKNKEKTDEVLKEGWLNSGDVFVWTVDGELKFAGRAKDTIVLAGGENVEPGPIEMALAASEFISQAMVVGQDKKTLGALIVPARDRTIEHFKTEGIEIPADMSAWHEDKEVHKFFNGIVKSVVSSDAGFKAFEKLSGFYLLGKEFEKGKEMTETMKIKRNIVTDMYEKEIEAIYE